LNACVNKSVFGADLKRLKLCPGRKYTVEVGSGQNSKNADTALKIKRRLNITTILDQMAVAVRRFGRYRHTVSAFVHALFTALISRGTANGIIVITLQPLIIDKLLIIDH